MGGFRDGLLSRGDGPAIIGRMLFPTTAFAVFFAVVLLLWFSGPRQSAPWRRFTLLFANFFFYCWWSWRFALLLAAMAAINHAFARALARRRSRPLLFAAVAANLLLLGVFKYAGFVFVSVVSPVVAALCPSAEALEAWNNFQFERAFPVLSSIVLPIGVSFTTFSAISYLADAASGKFRPARSFVDFFNYLSFFPKLCAGPIVRPADLIPALESPVASPSRSDFARASLLLALGLLKKTVVANWLSQNAVDPFFDDPSEFGLADALVATFGYAVQLYCDFSAYSDMAIALALMLGFRFGTNFDAPYLARSLQEFWRRWHISLSSWLRDYLYIPLGGSRRGATRTEVNLFVTMLLGGVWHGAGWAFPLWGAVHGAGLALERRLSRRLGHPVRPGILPVFAFTAAAWIPFRLGTGGGGLEGAGEVLRAFGRVATAPSLCSPAAFALLALGFASQLCDGRRLDRASAVFARLPAPILGLASALLLAFCLGLGPRGVAPFIYFQF